MNKSIKLMLGLSVLPAFLACQSNPMAEKAAPKVEFVNVTEDVNLITPKGMKYSGPAVADINHDGYYDLLLTDHVTNPPHLFWGQADYTFKKEEVFPRGDTHGIATGDFDLDGDADLLISVGGGNGSNPKPPHFYRNDNGKFIDLTDQVGISDYGARGRVVKWVDLDADGDLDFFEINAVQLVDKDKPRNVVFENLGNGSFEYKKSEGFEHAHGERALLTDFNNDDILDVVLFSPLTVWQGNGQFSFTDVTAEIIPTHLLDLGYTLVAADPDIDNDGDKDLYLARGKVYSQIANNALDFRPDVKRFDLRDSGQDSRDSLEFTADGDVTLVDFGHFPRNLKDPMPLYVGANKTKFDSVEEARTLSQQEADGFPAEISEFGWYLGYLGNNRWRLEWNLFGDLAWDLRASVKGVSAVFPAWTPQGHGVPDVLLRNDGGKFVDISNTLPIESNDNNWGVTHGDFDNDGFEDLFVYRFGMLKQRLPDVLMMNNGDQTFSSRLDHGANVLNQGGHGDMGSAFDYNMDGAIDILSGDDDLGRWYMYENTLKPSESSNYILVRVGYSPKGIDPLAAKIVVETDNLTLTRHVASAGAAFSQSALSIAHFGLAGDNVVKKVTVHWRDGSAEVMSEVDANQLIKFGQFVQ